MSLYEYKGRLYPTYLRDGNAMRFIEPVAAHFCRGDGIDVGCGRWCLPGALGVDIADGGNALDLPRHAGEGWDYIFSSHCLEHLDDPVAALEHWRDRLRPGGTLFLYLPHPDMEYWRPQHCRKHRHIWHPEGMVPIVHDLGFRDVIHSGRDMAWSFAVIGWKP